MGLPFFMREGLGFEMTHSADTILGCVETASFCGGGLKFLLDCIRHLLDARLPPFLQGLYKTGFRSVRQRMMNSLCSNAVYYSTTQQFKKGLKLLTTQTQKLPCI